MISRKCLRLFVLLICCGLLGSADVYAQNPLLRELAREDQDSRTGKAVTRTDADRAKLVLEQIAKDALKVPEDKFNAALVLQHTGLTFCENKLVSLSPDNYLLAHHLAKNAFESGHKESRNLVAATIDRYLSFTAGYQKYGTQRVTNQETGKRRVGPH